MCVVRTNRSDPNFYLLVGPYFGSRKIERQTRDRFYDDPGKIWFVTEGGAASLLPGFGTLRRGRPGHPPSVSLWK